MKKILSFALTMLLALGVATGCGAPTGNSGSKPSEVNLHPDENVTATLRVAVENYTAEKKIISEIGEILTAKYPNVTVKIETISGGISSQYATWFRNKNVPDILVNNSFDMFTLSDKGLLSDLTPYLDAEAADPESTFDINDYYESYIKMGQANFDGEQYMIPRSADRVVCHYNKAIFKAAGVDMSLVRNGWTWDDFMTVCATLRKYYDSQDSMKAYTLVDPYFTWEAVYNPIFESYGVEYYDENGEVALESDATENALKFIKSIIDNKYASRPSVEQAGMAGNKGCMLFHSQAASLMATELSVYYPDAEKVSDYYVVTMPVIPGHEKIGCGAAGYSVYDGSENKDLAWQFLKILLSKEGQNIMADSGSNYVPVRKDMADYTNPENHWGKGYEDLNLSAYTYNCGAGDDPDWNCYTTYIARKAPKYASSVGSALSTLIANYCNGVADYATSIRSCTNAIKRILAM